jgi:hypothetical protein
MAERSVEKGTQAAAQDRDARLKAALKANLARRKAQARGRADNEDHPAAPPADEVEGK